MWSLGIEPTTFALLTQCSTTEPQEQEFISSVEHKKDTSKNVKQFQFQLNSTVWTKNAMEVNENQNCLVIKNHQNVFYWVPPKKIK